ncbi:hypothetical protein H5410_031996 [Solanum commersonii]|uniref:Uncharacterized protein n=1 Tax=Solanum commersonii TaxID=4109 RepID=A0A9J5YJT1_SOLCO|nr:hypothetical protein H5410_031996 [Solanum commersonii]
MGFWEPSIVTFKFLDFEVTPTLEEIGDFLSLLDLHIFRSLRFVDGRHIELDFLFQRFGSSEGYCEYQREFECIRGAWEYMRPIIESHEDHLQNWVGALIGREKWCTFFNNLTGEAI